MHVSGIVAEYNPFHTGHARHLAETRRLLGMDTALVCVMSGNFVQRGECALVDKWRRAGAALAGGADLILELPTLWAVSSAESFAQGAVSLLLATGVVDTLSFGSESGDVEALRRAAACLRSPEYHALVRTLAGTGLSFPAARQQAAAALLGSEEAAACLSRPNDNLAVEYLRSAPAGMPALAIPRFGPAHDGGTFGDYASASHLRSLLRAGDFEGASPFLHTPVENPLASLSYCEPALLYRLRLMEEADWAALPDSGASEGLPARLVRCAREAVSAEDFLTRAKTRRYTHARLRRLLLWAFLGLRAGDRPEAPPYLRVLGFNDRGRDLLRQMKGTASLPVLTQPSQIRGCSPEAQRVFSLEARCTDLFGLCEPVPRPCGREWTQGPVRQLSL